MMVVVKVVLGVVVSRGLVEKLKTNRNNYYHLPLPSHLIPPPNIQLNKLFQITTANFTTAVTITTTPMPPSPPILNHHHHNHHNHNPINITPNPIPPQPRIYLINALLQHSHLQPIKKLSPHYHSLKDMYSCWGGGSVS